MAICVYKEHDDQINCQVLGILLIFAQSLTWPSQWWWSQRTERRRWMFWLTSTRSRSRLHWWAEAWRRSSRWSSTPCGFQWFDSENRVQRGVSSQTSVYAEFCWCFNVVVVHEDATITPCDFRTVVAQKPEGMDDTRENHPWMRLNEYIYIYTHKLV